MSRTIIPVSVTTTEEKEALIDALQLRLLKLTQGLGEEFVKVRVLSQSICISILPENINKHLDNFFWLAGLIEPLIPYTPTVQFHKEGGFSVRIPHYNLKQLIL